MALTLAKSFGLRKIVSECAASFGDSSASIF
jgi:hypothetical protein